MAKKGVTKARRRGFELQSSELWGSKIDLSAQLQIQLMGFETKSVPFFRLKVSTLFVFFSIFWGLILPRNNRESRAKNGLRVQAICSCDRAWLVKEGYRASGTTQRIPKINHYKMRFRFMSVKWNAATRYSAHPFTTKTGARVHFFCLNYPRIRGRYQARVHPFSSGNGKGDLYSL